MTLLTPRSVHHFPPAGGPTADVRDTADTVLATIAHLISRGMAIVAAVRCASQVIEPGSIDSKLPPVKDERIDVASPQNLLAADDRDGPSLPPPSATLQ